ncbi:MAG: S8 family serine peptidase [Elainella sp.]
MAGWLDSWTTNTGNLLIPNLAPNSTPNSTGNLTWNLSQDLSGNLGREEPGRLWRGGEPLAVEPCPDRYGVGLRPQMPVAELSDLLQEALANAAISTGAILPGLIELQAAPESLEPLIQQLRQSPQVAFVHPVYQLRQSPGTLLYLTDQITIQFRETVASERIQQLAPAGLRILKLVTGVAKAFVFQISDAAIHPLRLADQLIQQPDVLLAEPNVAVLRQPFYRPRESGYKRQWYLHHEGGEDLAPNSHIFAEAAWNLTKGKRSVAVAVADSSIDLRHPDLQSEGKIVAPLALQAEQLQVNPQQPDQQPDQQPASNHGTTLARVIVADETGKGIIGVAPGCALMPIRLGEFIDDQAVEQLCQWVIDQRADVLCCGWGAAAVYFPLSLRQRVALAQAATQGRDGRGCVVVFAAGNANRPLDGAVNEQGWPNQTLQGETRWLNGFALHPDVIAVAACTSLNQKAAGSNWGDSVSVAAPSGSSSPTLLTQLLGQVDTAPIPATQLGRAIELDPAPQASPALALTQGGTSVAAAIVAGVAALMLSVNPDLTAREVQQILEQTADRIVDDSTDSQLNLSLGQYDAYRHSAWLGYGKVSAIRAVELAQRRLLPLTLPDRWLPFIQSQPLPLTGLAVNSSAVQVAETNPIRDLEVSVELEHDFLGDLELCLVAPWGTVIPLQSRSLGRLTQLKTIYSLETAPWLKTALNHSAQGEWQLQILDRVQTRRGQLLRWQLNLGL